MNPHTVEWPIVSKTAVESGGRVFRVSHHERGLVVEGDDTAVRVGAYASVQRDGFVVKLSRGAETYYEARDHQGRGFTDADLVGVVVVAALIGHPDAEKDREGTALRAVWSHHLAIVGGEDPRRVSTTYAPSEAKTISHRVQSMAAAGVRILQS